MLGLSESGYLKLPIGDPPKKTLLRSWSAILGSGIVSE